MPAFLVIPGALALAAWVTAKINDQVLNIRTKGGTQADPVGTSLPNEIFSTTSPVHISVTPTMAGSWWDYLKSRFTLPSGFTLAMLALSIIGVGFVLKEVKGLVRG